MYFLSAFRGWYENYHKIMMECDAILAHGFHIRYNGSCFEWNFMKITYKQSVHLLAWYFKWTRVVASKNFPTISGKLNSLFLMWWEVEK